MGTVKDKIVNSCRGTEFDELKRRFQNASTRRTVELRWNGPVDESVEDLCQTLASNPRLQSLVISQITAFGTDRGGKLLADLLMGSPRLKTLNLRSLNPTFGCVDALCKALELTGATLESFSVDDTELSLRGPITQRLARMLSTNTSIKHFSISHTSIQSENPPADAPWSSDQSHEQAELEESMELERIRRRHMESEAKQDCMSLVDMLRRNQSLRSLSLSIYLGEAGPKTIIAALEQNTVTLEELHIHNILSWGQTALTTLIKALTRPHQPKLRLKLLLLNQTADVHRVSSAESSSTTSTVSPSDLPHPEVLAEMLLHNQTLRTLLICHGYREEDWESVIVPAIAYNSTLNLVHRFPDPCSYATHPQPPWAGRLLLRFNCIRCFFKAGAKLMPLGEKWLTPSLIDYKVLSGSSHCFGFGATYSRLRGCRRLLHMAGDLQCWSKYPSAAARWTVKTSSRTYVLSFEDYSA